MKGQRNMCRSIHQPTLTGSRIISARSRIHSVGEAHVFEQKIGQPIAKKVAASLLILSFLAVTCLAQQKVSGVVTTEKRVLLSGATITIKGARVGTMTGADGSFSIVANPKDVLVISFIGYDSKEVRVDSKTSLNVSLSPSINNLDQVVVTGYTSQKIKEIAGSVAVVNPKDLTALPAGQVEQMLQGRVAGLTVLSSGEPGAPVNVWLHGIGNFGNVTPLYIVDGVEMPNVNNINPYDIESLQVLKDAGVYSVYGVRGANGVVVITTKKGKTIKTKLSYEFYVGWQQPLQKGLDLLNPQEQADLLWIASKNSHDTAANGYPSDPLYGNGPTPVLPDYIQPYGAHEGDPGTDPASYNNDPRVGPINQIARFNKKGTDWFHEMFKPAFKQSHTVTISGAHDDNHYLLSFGYLDQQGTFVNDYLKRFTTRVNAEFTLLSRVHIGENLQLNYHQNPRLWNTQSFNTLTADPSLPVYDIKGNLFPGVYGSQSPAYLASLLKYDKQNNWEIFGNAFAEIELPKNFTFRSSLGGTIDYYYAYNYAFGSYMQSSNLYNSSFFERSGYNRGWTWTNMLNFSTTFLNDHHLKVLTGTEEKSNYSRELGGSRTGYFVNDPGYFTLTTGNPNGQTNYSFAAQSYLYSFVGQASYNYKEKYFVSGTIRRDGSSVFDPKTRYGWFPAVAAAWRMTEGNFLKPLMWLTDLKLRGSWGETGFYGNTDPYNQYTLYGGGPGGAYYDINGNSTGNIQQGFRTVRIGNSHTGWQRDVVWNVGADAILWKGKLKVTADAYNKRSKGLLFPAAIPAYLGADAIPPNVNVGDVKNSGIDLLIGSKGAFSKNWDWDLTLTFTSYHNTIERINGLPFFYDVFSWAGPLVRNEVGHPIGSFYGYKIIGFFQSADDVAKSPKQDSAAVGRFKYLDANGDGKIDDSDQVYYGNPNPKFTLGLNLGINFKNFDFSTFLYGSFGGKVLNDLAYRNDIFSTGLVLNQKSKTALYNSWRPDHRNAKAPIPENNQNFSNAAVVNSYRLENGSYLRNKIITLGYTFPSHALQKIKIERFRIYVQVVNLFTFTRYTGLDPELAPGTGSAFGVDFGNYPGNEKQYLVGCSLSL